MNREDTVVALLLDIGRQQILDYFPMDSSIAATRVGIDVLAHFSIMSVPVAVKVEVVSFQGETTKLGSRRHSPHLVAYLPGKRQILDLALDQASEPKAEMTFTASLFPVHPHFTSTPKYRESFMVPQPNGWPAALVVYESILGKDFESAPEWKRQVSKGKDNAFSKLTASLISEISKRLGD